MRQLIFLFLFVPFIFSSCSKKDDDSKPTQTTEGKLQGKWEVVQSTYVFYDINSVVLHEEKDNDKGIILSFKNGRVISSSDEGSGEGSYEIDDSKSKPLLIMKDGNQIQTVRIDVLTASDLVIVMENDGDIYYEGRTAKMADHSKATDILERIE